MGKPLITSYEIAEERCFKTREEIRGTIMLKDGEFFQTAFKSYAGQSLCFDNFVAFEAFATLFLKTLKQMDKLEMIDITEVCDFLRCQ